MAVFKCKMCGGALEIHNKTVAACEYCGTQQTLPKSDDERRANLYNRGNHFRRNNEFDKAMGIYEQILNDDTTDAEVYWSLVLCRYGIEYVEDPSSHKRIPTVNRAQFTSIFDDTNYKSALQYADSDQRRLYEEEANTINDIQKGFLTISQKEEPFDVFICYKETDQNGCRTPDSVLANDLYHQLTVEGFKVFFARITLEDKLGSAYEPYIFAALNSAKVMVVLGTKPEFFNAAWVKNEWSRYLSLIKNGADKMLIPAYKDMDPYDLPDEFSHLQAQDMSKLGFMQDLIRGIKKIAQKEEPKTVVVKETVVTSDAAGNVQALLDRGFMAIEDGKWEKADEFFEQSLNQNAKLAEAYLGKLMVELKVEKQELLKNCVEPFDHNPHYQKAVRFADEKQKAMLLGCIEHIHTRNENARLQSAYEKAQAAMNAAKTESAFKEAAKSFQTIRDYRDAASLAQTCREKAETARKDAILFEGNAKMLGNSSWNYTMAIQLFESIAGWKDADEKIAICQKRIEEIKAKAESDRLKKERARQQAKRAAKRTATVVAIATSVVCVIVAVIMVFNMVIIPNGKYNDALAVMDEGKYTEAIAIFESLDSYKDSADKIQECNTAIAEEKYNEALALMDEGKYTEAIAIFESLDSYEDSADKIQECNTAIAEEKYTNALALMDEGKYTDAIAIFESLDSYKDSADKIQECNTAIAEEKYNDALALMDEGKYTEAYEVLVLLDGYKDSADIAKSIRAKSVIDSLKNDVSLGNVKIGNSVYFGEYEQDNNIVNGKEYIEWLVLDIQDDRMLVVSRYALDCKKYNEQYAETTWENCTLREWLNNEFINTAFSEEEQSLIPTVTVSADENLRHNTDPGNATQDKVFLLSALEADAYFDSDDARKCTATDYAIANGTDVHGSDNTCCWDLRTPGFFQIYVSSVYITGMVNLNGGSVSGVVEGVRPALWIDWNI